jgi:hypothetical protein
MRPQFENVSVLCFIVYVYRFLFTVFFSISPLFRAKKINSEEFSVLKDLSYQNDEFWFYNFKEDKKFKFKFSSLEKKLDFTFAQFEIMDVKMTIWMNTITASIISISIFFIIIAPDITIDIYARYGTIFFLWVLFFHWGHTQIHQIANFHQRLICLYELLFHENDDIKYIKHFPIRRESRLDPSVPQNISLWLILRMKYLEEPNFQNKIRNSLEMLNRAFVFCVIFMLWILYTFVIENALNVKGVNLWTQLSLIYIFSILIPLFYKLNCVVSTFRYANLGCHQKLNKLLLGVELMTK